VLFLNLVPLLELDGYWIFSDLLQMPDLRPRSLTFVRRQLWSRLRHRQRLTRQEVGLAIYGTLGVAFTIFSFYGAFYFWRHILGGLFESLWGGGPFSRGVLLVLSVVVAGPIIRAGIDVGRALAKIVQEWVRRLRFRFETAWRIEAAELLEASPVFDDLDVDVLNELAGRVTRQSVPAGSTVFEQGDRATALYVVRHGRFAVVERELDTGHERTLTLMGRGQVFGELALLTNAPRSASVRAVSAGELFVLPKGAFDHLLADVSAAPRFGPGLQELDELRHIDCFAHLTTAELSKVQDNGSWMQVAPGDNIVSRGEKADAFYGVRSGQVEVLIDRTVVDVLGPGSWFGERGLLGNTTRQATVRARTPARLFRLERRGFDDMLRAAFQAGGTDSHRRQQRSWEH
jgi:CRP-like cAMP-binding protein